MKCKKGSHLEIFPNELLIEIFSYLDGRELLTCWGVCKRWRNMLNDENLWTEKINKEGMSFLLHEMSRGQQLALEFGPAPPLQIACSQMLLFNDHIRVRENWKRGNYKLNSTKTGGRGMNKNTLACNGTILIEGCPAPGQRKGLFQLIVYKVGDSITSLHTTNQLGPLQSRDGHIQVRNLELHGDLLFVMVHCCYTESDPASSNVLVYRVMHAFPSWVLTFLYALNREMYNTGEMAVSGDHIIFSRFYGSVLDMYDKHTGALVETRDLHGHIPVGDELDDDEDDDDVAGEPLAHGDSENEDQGGENGEGLDVWVQEHWSPEHTHHYR